MDAHTGNRAASQNPRTIASMSPADARPTWHHGLAEQRVAARATVLAAAYAAHPERFPAGLPIRRRVPWRCGSTHPRLERQRKLAPPMSLTTRDPGS